MQNVIMFAVSNNNKHTHTMRYLATTTPTTGRAFAVSFKTQSGWRNLTWFGNTLYFKHERTAKAVRWLTNADFISHYTI